MIMIDKFRAWMVKYQDEISWFLIGVLSMGAFNYFTEQEYFWAAVNAVLAYANYKLTKYPMK